MKDKEGKKRQGGRKNEMISGGMEREKRKVKKYAYCLVTKWHKSDTWFGSQINVVCVVRDKFPHAGICIKRNASKAES